jgi:hypothetical protein
MVPAVLVAVQQVEQPITELATLVVVAAGRLTLIHLATADQAS